MELYQLKGFVAVAELGHMTRAAERLHVSQPALSAQIRALESQLSLKLFERVSGGMRLTAAGRQLLSDAEVVLDAADQLRNRARALCGEPAGQLRVGTVSEPEFIQVAEFLGATIQRFPMIRVEFHHGVTGAVFERVRDGELDAGFYYGELGDPDVASLKLRDIAYRVIAAPSWQARIERAHWEDIARMPWVMASEISTHHHLVMGLFRRHGSTPAKVVEADQESILSSLAMAGAGLGLMREERALRQRELGEVCIWGDVRLETTLRFVYRRKRSDDPLIRAVLDVLSAVWARGAS